MKVIYDKIQFFGGAERVLLQIDKALKPTSIVTLCNVKDPSMKSIEQKTIYPYWGLFFIKFSIFVSLYPLVCFLSTLVTVRDDIIFCYSSTCGKYFNLKSKKNILYTNFPARGIIEPEKFVKNKLLLLIVKFFTNIFKVFERMQYKKFDQIYCISDYTKKLLMKHYNVDSEVLYCPTSKIFFQNNNKKYQRESYFVLVSRLEEHKNLDYVFETFSKLDQELIVLGTGKLLDKYTDLYPKISFKGYVSDEIMIDFLSKAKASIIPTFNEYSLPIIESFARGTPVISIKCAASDELVLANSIKQNIRLGVIFNDASVKSLRNAINNYNEDRKEFNSMNIIDYSKIFNPSIFEKKLQKIIRDNS